MEPVAWMALGTVALVSMGCGEKEESKMAPQTAIGFWWVTRYTARCPLSPSEQDPHPDFRKKPQFKHQRGG
jgi:hypothetical protein